MMNNKTDFLDNDIELIKTQSKLNKLIALNLSLYNAILDYAERKRIPLPIDTNIIALVEDIAKTDGILLSRRNFTEETKRDEADEEFTAPW